MVIVFNPAAGNRRVHRLWRVLDILAANGVRCEVARTTGAGEARELAAAAAASGARQVVAAGGDGTIAEVASGLLGTGAALGVIPLGTANVLAHEYALPFAPRAVAAALAFGRTRPLWPGIAEDAAGGTRPFVQMLGIGFDAAVVHRLSPRPGEPGFSVVLFDRPGPWAALCYGAALPLGRLATAPGIRRLRARVVEVIGNRDLRAQTDGDPAAPAPRIIRDASCVLPLVVG